MQAKRTLRIYADTSVFGGCLDATFAEHSQRLFKFIADGRLKLIVSDVVIQELKPAPARVRAILEQLPSACIEQAELSTGVIDLRDAYLEADILSRDWIDDATHVAIATVSRADAIVSWNFRHIVRLEKIQAYNQVNLANGYGILTILSPQEVSYDDAET